MPIELRYARPDEWPAVTDLDAASFGLHYSDADREEAKLDLDPARILVAVDDGRMVAVSGEVAFALTLPGGRPVPTTGLSWVSVEVTHRRRGILRALVERQLRASATQGDAAVILRASEGGIYARYGFGVATQVRHSVVRRRRARLATRVDTSAVRRLPTPQARDVLPGIHDRWRLSTPGGIDRDERRWQLMLSDSEWLRDGKSSLFHLVHPDGYVSYRIKQEWGTGDPQHECVILDYAPVTADAHAALWQTLLAMDLVGDLTSYELPLDDPLPLLLDDPRGVETTHLGDALWLRPLDVPALLGGRAYAVDLDVVLAVRDPLLGDARYRLRGGPDGADCAPTDAAADLELDVGTLGAVCLGGSRLGWFARAGLVAARNPALLARADVALLADREPRTGTYF